MNTLIILGYDIGIWVIHNLAELLGTAVSTVVAILIYRLSKQLGLRGRLEHRASVAHEVETLLSRIAKGGASKCEIVNVRRYPKDYLGENNRNRHGYVYQAGELKTLRFDGIEFFIGVRELYVDSDGKLSLDKSVGKPAGVNAFEVGVMPFEWIEFVEPGGDEYSYRPQFFVQFKGLNKSPYRYLRYYRESTTYHPESDPMDYKWSELTLS